MKKRYYRMQKITVLIKNNYYIYIIYFFFCNYAYVKLFFWHKFNNINIVIKYSLLIIKINFKDDSPSIPLIPFFAKYVAYCGIMSKLRDLLNKYRSL